MKVWVMDTGVWLVINGWKLVLVGVAFVLLVGLFHYWDGLLDD